MMYKAAVSDTDILVNLAKVERLDILGFIFKEIVIPEYVYDREIKRKAKKQLGIINSAINKEESIFTIRNRREEPAINLLAKDTIEDYSSIIGKGESECAGYATALRIPIIISDNSREFKWLESRYIMLTHIDILYLCIHFSKLSQQEAESIFDSINDMLEQPTDKSFDVKMNESRKAIKNKGWHKPLRLPD